MLTDDALNLAADAIATAADHFSVHTAFSATGASEATGGSYARQPNAFGAAAAGVATQTGTEDIDVAAGTYKYIGLWSALSAGTFYGMVPIGSTGLKKCYAIASTDVIHAEAHGFVDNDIVVFFGSALPTGITQGTEYHVITDETDSFQIAATQGGAAINITDEGFGLVSKLVAEVFGSAGIIRVQNSTIDLRGVKI